MRQFFFRAALTLLVACSAGRDDSAIDGVGSPVGGTGGVAGPGAGGTGGTPGGSGTQGGAGTPSGTANPGGQTGGTAGGGFQQCAETKAGAQRAPRGSNIVWAIDTSGSMDEEAALVQQNLNRFVQAVTAAGLEDYRVVVISERSFVTVPEPLGSDAKHFLHIEEKVSSDESLSDMLERFNDFSGFLLKGVVTHFVSVTDDESQITAQDFIARMKSRLTSEFRVHAIASPPGDNSAAGGGSIFDDDDDDTGCQGPFGAAAEPGVQHFEAAKLTSGLSFSICTEDWSALFTELAKVVGETATVPCALKLPVPPSGQMLDFNLINVVYTAQGATQGERLPRAQAATNCGTQRGWYYEGPATNPSGIVLCPASCTAAAGGGQLDVALGCSSVLF